MLSLVELEHRPIRGWFRSGRGLRLQRFDSTIADAVLNYPTHRGVPCLPVHDSFIVPESAERMLRETMVLAYREQAERFGAVKADPVIAGWSSPEVEARAKEALSRAAPPLA